MPVTLSTPEHHGPGSTRRNRWLEWGAAAALLLVLLGVGGSYLYHRALNRRLADALGDLQHPEMVQALLEKGADPHTRGLRGYGVMTYANYTRSSKVMALALHCGISPEERDGPAATTPLMGAILSGNAECVRLLLEHGANPNRFDFRSSPLEVAAQHARQALQPMTYLNGRPAVDRGNPVVEGASMIRLLIRAGADVNSKDRPLVTAASCPSPEPLRLLLKAGADPNGADAGSITPLMAAARQGRAENVRILLQHHARPDFRDPRGQTALSLAQGTLREVEITPPVVFSRGMGMAPMVNPLSLLGNSAPEVKRNFRQTVNLLQSTGERS